MDEIDRALTEAWERVAAAVRADRLAAARRAARRGRAVLTRPMRAWSLCLRASDTRLGVHAGVPKYLPERNEPHEIVVFAETLRALCRPVRIPWPGMDWTRAAARLGRHPEGIRSWIRRGVFQVRHRYARSMSKRGKPVPEIWCDAALDPNWDQGRGPDTVWGTLWQHLWERVPDGLEQVIAREPEWRERGGHRMRLKWQFVCPGLAARGRDGETERRRDEAEERGENGAPRASCGRRVDRLYLPLKPWTIAGALGDDPLAEDGPGTGCAAWQEGSAVPRLACRVCHRMQWFTLVDRNAWNRFVAHVSGGLLYGYEVARPAAARGVRRKRFVSPRRRDAERLAARRSRVLGLLAEGLTRRQVCSRLGMRLGTLKDDIRRLYREHAARGRTELVRRAGMAAMAAVQRMAA